MGNYSFRPITLREANLFVGEHHRHNRPVRACKFTVSLVDEQGLVGVGIAGLPVNPQLANEGALEITRVCVLEGHKNASSMIYSRLKKIAQLMGYTKIITYTLFEEPGGSLRAVGARQDGLTKGDKWTRKGRPRQEQPIYKQKKIRWRL